ncbi:MAG: hypothetical protein JW722_00625 [Demequinaceae bacterium]|nr:hypothetical protein [Demequinaceae bacterium]
MKTRRPMTTAALVCLALSATACEWRLETPDPSPLIPDATEAVRDAAAVAEARLVEALPYADPGGPGAEWLYEFESLASDVHLDALGGVYDPYPDPAPDPSPTSDPSLGPTSFSRFASLARDAAVEGALTVEDADLALLLAAIGLSHAAALRLQSEEDARASGVEVDVSADRLLPLPPGLADTDPSVSMALVPEATLLSEETLTGLILLTDYAVYVFQLVAARAEGPLRGVAYLRSLLLEERAAALVSLVGSDPRGPSYVTDRTRLASNEAMEDLMSEVEADLADAYVAAFAEVVKGDADSVEERAWLLSAAFDALVGSWVHGVEPGEAPMFPGVTVPGYAPREPAPSPSAGA